MTKLALTREQNLLAALLRVSRVCGAHPNWALPTGIAVAFALAACTGATRCEPRRLAAESLSDRSHSRREPKHCSVALPPTAPLTTAVLAAAAFEGYASDTGRVRLLADPVADAGDPLVEFAVRSCQGDVVTSRQRSFDELPGTVKVTFFEGEGWATHLKIAWLTVGAVPGLCAAEQGILALFSRSGPALTVKALAPWQGSCATEPHQVHFLTVAGGRVLLETDGDSGEEATTERWDRVWLVTDSSLRVLGKLRTGFEETREPWSVPGVQRRMEATVKTTPTGFLLEEIWHFAPLRTGGAPSDRRVERRVLLRDQRLIVPDDPDPLPSP